ncbi:MAG TPA: M48 family metallopeptidase [Solirubrobacterales bacterium]|jgi:STE24 endopeptidase|nr:M48 family metallopeptidase [Solirubrobacterales bacterium]
MARAGVIRQRIGGTSPLWLRIGATAVAAIVVAEGAAWLLRPREAIEPVEVSETAYFSQEQLDRAHEYRSGQRLLMIGGLAAEGVLLVLLVAGKPAFARRALERAGARPVLGGAAAGAGIALAVAVTSLPFDVAAHERAKDVGLATQDLGAWAVDWAKANAINVAILAAVATGALALIRRSPRRWWIPGSAAVVVIGVVLTWLGPVVLAPLFNDFEPLEPGQARSDVLELGERAGVDIGEVYRVDASRRSTSINAYVNGLGPTKRVVLYDTLLEELDRGERRAVVAHELAHVKNHDIQRGIAFVAIAAPLALLFTARFSRALGERTGARPGRPEFLPALAISLLAASFAIGVVGNQLSRDVEAKADLDALELTGDPDGMIELQQRLADTNLSDPDPPEWYSALFRTHPTTMQRIGMALAWERGARP